MDAVIVVALVVLAFPCGLLVVFGCAIAFFVCRPLPRAWDRCARYWIWSGHVDAPAPHDGFPFGHYLAVALARTHPRGSEFFLARLSDPNPILAAYAFKCLIRVRELRLSDIPREIRRREDVAPLLWADHLFNQSLREFIVGYFGQRRAARQRMRRGLLVSR